MYPLPTCPTSNRSKQYSLDPTPELNYPLPTSFDGNTCSPSQSPPTITQSPSSTPTANPSSTNFNLSSLLISNVQSLASKVDELAIVAAINEIEIICITETWFTPNIPDSAISIPNFIVFRNDRLSSVRGGVCIYINCNITCKRLIDFENPAIESLWLSLRPRHLPRSISVILLAVIYHTTSSGTTENLELYNHIQTGVDSFLRCHLDALVLITGDFNPASTGFNPASTGFDKKQIKRLTGLVQIIKVATRENSVSDWCLVNIKELVYDSIQLPPIGSSDHNTILIKSHLHRSQKPDNSEKKKRDLRDSNLRKFGQWITTFD